MDKSVFVMDTPEKCVGCPFCGHEYAGEGMSKNPVASYCCLNAHKIKNIEGKPGWYPLRPLPEKMTGIAPTDHSNSIKAGWNACIDEITGGNDNE